MKILVYPIVCWLLLSVSQPVLAQDEQENNPYQQLKEAMEAGEIIMRFYEATTQRGNTVNLESSSNAVVLTPLASAGNLPFYGNTRVLTSDFGSGNLEFDGNTERRRVKYNDKKERIILSYSVKGAADRFSISLTLNAAGAASMSVSSVNRDRISYRGNYQIQ